MGYFYSSCLHICAYAGTIIMFAVLRERTPNVFLCNTVLAIWSPLQFPRNRRIRLANSKERSRFDLERDCIEPMGQSRMAMLLISIDILLAINNSKSLPLPRAFSVPLGSVLYFLIHKSCMPLAKYISVYYIVFLVSLADCLSSLYKGPCLWTEKVWIPSNLDAFCFVLFFLPNCSCESFSGAAGDSGKGICVSSLGVPCFFRSVPSHAQEVLLWRDSLWWPRGCMAAALSALCSTRAAWHRLRSCENPFEHALRFSSLNSVRSFYTCICGPLLFCLLMCIWLSNQSNLT